MASTHRPSLYNNLVLDTFPREILTSHLAGYGLSTYGSLPDLRGRLQQKYLGWEDPSPDDVKVVRNFFKREMTKEKLLRELTSRGWNDPASKELDADGLRRFLTILEMTNRACVIRYDGEGESEKPTAGAFMSGGLQGDDQPMHVTVKDHISEIDDLVTPKTEGRFLDTCSDWNSHLSSSCGTSRERWRMDPQARKEVEDLEFEVIGIEKELVKVKQELERIKNP
ncbi:hypothetical protein VTL71DRAFT_846 [Oculimacula yallundae]|uniref:Uncharacterized protein n=1 Tax=Oculimacula yallundae TaxID=86028 RepID=A0ABR4D165_9HELO